MSTHSPGWEATHQGAEATSQRPDTALNHVEAIKPLVGSMDPPPPGIAAGGWSGGRCDAKRQACTGGLGRQRAQPPAEPPPPRPVVQDPKQRRPQRERLPGSAGPQRGTSAEDTPSKRRFQCTQAAHLCSSHWAGTGLFPPTPPAPKIRHTHAHTLVPAPSPRPILAQDGFLSAHGRRFLGGRRKPA